MRPIEILYQKLMQTWVVWAKWETYFKLNGIETIVNDSSIVGNVIQEWLKSFMLEKDIPFRTIPNTQEFPDFLMWDSDTKELLEVKCFKKSPNFDIANFLAYARSLLSKPYRLNADYLIFEYLEVHWGIIIKNIWLKKVWEICWPSERSPLKIQWKQWVPVNIRPAVWYSKRTNFPPFLSRKDFVHALKRVIDTSTITNSIQRNWESNVTRLFKEQTGEDL